MRAASPVMAKRRQSTSNNFMVEVTTTDVLQVMDIDLVGAVDFPIDWGDGAVTYHTGATRASHTYVTEGVYEVSMSGVVTRLRFDNANANLRLTGILTPLSALSQINSCYFMFFGCNKITSIPAGMFKGMDKILTNAFWATFYQCTGLTSIPGDIFHGCTAALNFYYTFWGCTGLTTLPAGLFANGATTGSKVLQWTFQGCTGLTALPAGLFAGCGPVTSLSNCFWGCSYLTSVPAGLLDDCVSVTTLQDMFGLCVRLTSVPANLFDNCTELRKLQGLFQQSTLFDTIHSGMFQYNTKLTSINRLFNSTDVTSIPSNLFASEAPIADVSYAFHYCNLLTGNSLALWDRTTTPTTTVGCYTGCTGLTDFATIPAAYL